MDFFLDTFQGTGPLASHTSDSGLAWTVINSAPPGNPQVANGLIFPLVTGAGTVLSDARSEIVLTSTSNTFTVRADVNWNWDADNFNGFFSIGIRSSASTFEMSIQLFADIGPSIYIGVGDVTYASVTSLVNGHNVLEAALDLENQVASFYVNGVLAYYGPKYQTFTTPFGAYVAFNNGDGSTGPPFATIVVNEMKITDEAPVPPTPDAFWTNKVKTREVL